MSRQIESAWKQKKNETYLILKKEISRGKKKTPKSNNLVQAAFNVFSDMALYESRSKRDCAFEDSYK